MSYKTIFLADLIIQTRQRGIFFQMHKVSLRHFQQIEKYGNSLHWGIFSLLISRSKALRATVWNLEPSSFLSLTFKAIIGHLELHFRCLELHSQHSKLSIFSLAFKAVVFSLAFRATFFSFLAFRAPFQAFRVLFPAFRVVGFQFGVQSHCFQFAIQNHLLSSIWCSKPHFKHSKSHSQHSNTLVFNLAFITIVHSLAFRATFFSQFSVQSHSRAFKAVFQAFRVTFPTFKAVKFQFGIQSHCFQFGIQSHLISSIWNSKPQSGIQSLISGVQSRILSIQRCQFLVQCS